MERAHKMGYSRDMPHALNSLQQKRNTKIKLKGKQH